MLEKISIKNYQSHTDTEFELGPLTVLVGASSTGKSAITRAIKALASNQSGKDFITHGENTMQISATTDKGTVVLTKGKPEDSYVILLNDDPNNPRRFTKLGGNVPQEVTDFLGIAPKDAVNFAGQFDMPYLLRSSPAEVARTLGEITNVAAVFEAARESLRRKNQFSSTLKTRENDVTALEPRLNEFTSLEERLTAIEAAEAALNAATRLSERLNALDDLLMTLKVAKARVAQAEVSTAPLPDLTPAESALSRLKELESLTASLGLYASALRTATSAIESTYETIVSLEEEYDLLLKEVGTCPTCGQDTTNVHAHA